MLRSILLILIFLPIASWATSLDLYRGLFQEQGGFQMYINPEGGSQLLVTFVQRSRPVDSNHVIDQGSTYEYIWPRDFNKRSFLFDCDFSFETPRCFNENVGYNSMMIQLLENSRVYLQRTKNYAGSSPSGRTHSFWKVVSDN